MKSTNRLKFYCNKSCPKVALHANMGLQKMSVKGVKEYEDPFVAKPGTEQR